jgi:hypothetical protein
VLLSCLVVVNVNVAKNDDLLGGDVFSIETVLHLAYLGWSGWMGLRGSDALGRKPLLTFNYMRPLQGIVSAKSYGVESRITEYRVRYYTGR